MISMELSSVQQNTVKSAELSAAMAQFLAQGGTIYTAKGCERKAELEAKPYGRNHAPPVSGDTVPAKPSRKTGAVGVRASQAIKDTVRHLSTTMTLAQARVKTGLSGYVLKRIAQEGGFEFLAWDPCINLVERHTDKIADALNVVRIKDARDRGLSKKAAIRYLGISNTLLKRLILDYNIDYPLHRPSR